MATYLNFTKDGKQLLVASEDNYARLWDVQRGESRLTFRHRGVVGRARLNAANDLILTASRDGTARVWQMTNGVPLFAPLREGGELNAASFSPDGTRIATAGR